jgi:hypothetical protein
VPSSRGARAGFGAGADAQDLACAGGFCGSAAAPGASTGVSEPRAAAAGSGQPVGPGLTEAGPPVPMFVSRVRRGTARPPGPRRCRSEPGRRLGPT